MRNLSEDRPDIAYRTYAPVGSHRDLLAYLVRRLLENGANSSFVALAADESVPVATLLRRPADIIGAANHARHPDIPLPADLYQPYRKNSRGIEFGERAALGQAGRRYRAPSGLPADKTVMATPAQAEAAIAAARAGFRDWSRNAGRAARGNAGARRRSPGAAQGAFHRAVAVARAARRSTIPFPKCARPSTSAATTPRRGESCSATARRCRARPAKAMCCACAAAACSSRSRRGIFRWRSSWAR